MLDFTIYNFSFSSFNSYVTETEWAHFMIRRFYKTLPKAMGKKFAKKESNVTATAQPSPSPLRTRGEDVLISVHLKPGAKFTQVTDYSQESVGISVSAPPVEGEANLLLIKFMVEILGLKKSQVSLETGHKARNKVVCASRVDEEFVETKLRAALG
ncbi:UPF0235 protein C15orf40 homolog [Eurytemora carolleeae]|uniref:UPF0235 protein C15orf40 homolog n=1 Tax=Eurytemora carolleeae TaxID=1294199 RepID=UPI000C76E667|nr:UPF0235 protein C15orf40 homolog [Eurytemora carolleeae]|eukprot:XP_023335785.1 UPF0235 protein C15orf40 homolog [Eurytemora affinis]